MSGFCGRYAMAPSPPGGLFPMPVLWSTSPSTSTINCTVSGIVEDSMLDILEKKP